MKQQILRMTMIACVASAALVSCTTSPEHKAEEVQEAKENLADAKDELTEARLDSANEYLVYKEDAEAKLVENDRKIAELKANMKSEKKENKEKYENELSTLDQKNAKLKTNIQEYKDGTKDKDKWEEFKYSFNKEMDELGKSISTMANKNTNRK